MKHHKAGHNIHHKSHHNVHHRPTVHGHTGNIKAHHMTDKGHSGGHHASHATHNKSHSLPADVFGHAGEHYGPGNAGAHRGGAPSHAENCTYC